MTKTDPKNLESIESTLRTILAKIPEVKIPVADISGEAKLRDCGLNSLATITLIDHIEETFTFEFDAEDLLDSNFATLDTISHLIARRLGE